MQTDPIGYADGMNWYNYVHGDPVNGSDPDGMQECGAGQDYPTVVPVVCDAGCQQRIENNRFFNQENNNENLRSQYDTYSAQLPTTGKPTFNVDVTIKRTCYGSFCIPVGVDVHTAEVPPVPTDLVGVGPKEKKGKVNSGPLSPDAGGTGDADKDFDKLTGGTGRPVPGRAPGTLVGDNGVTIRPNSGGGRSIDIPGNGAKPPEVLHYPN